MAGLTATLFVQLASMVGCAAGRLAGRRSHAGLPGGRMMVQAFGVFAGAPFVVLCG